MEITTERLLLREFVEDDWVAVHAYRSDARYQEYYDSSESSLQAAQEFVLSQVTRQLEQPRIKFQLAVVLRSEHKLIGNCGIRKDLAEAQQADIGYELNPQYWGQGYATEAARAILDFGFNHLNVHRIWASCVADNARSRGVLEKLGMRQEGRLREVEFFKGRWWDTLIYAILKDDWERNCRLV